jgi:hypothetical protein
VKAVFVILPVFLVYSAWIGHNYIKFGETDFAPTYGYNLLERTIYLRAPEIDSQVFNSAYLKFTSHKANETYGDQKDEMYWWHSVMETAGELKRNENIFEVNRLFLFTALELIKSDPLGYIWSSIGEFGYIWAGYTTHSYKWRPAGGGKLADWSFLILGLVLGFIMFLLVTMGILDNLYRKNWLSLYLILPIIFITGFYALVSVTGYRYRLVVEPYILVVIGYSIINFKRGLWPIKKFFEI